VQSMFKVHGSGLIGLMMITYAPSKELDWFGESLHHYASPPATPARSGPLRRTGHGPADQQSE
jgi:hypothetical protein